MLKRFGPTGPSFCGLFRGTDVEPGCYFLVDLYIGLMQNTFAITRTHQKLVSKIQNVRTGVSMQNLCGDS